MLAGMDIRAEIAIDATPLAAWTALGERFGDIADWAAPIVASSCTLNGEGSPEVGSVRTCRTAGFGPMGPGTIQERLTAFDRDAMSFAYEAVSGMPGAVARAVNRWSIRPRGIAGCTVASQATVELNGLARPLGFLLRRSLERSGARVLEDLKHHLERGGPSPRKTRSVARIRGREGLVG